MSNKQNDEIIEHQQEIAEEEEIDICERCGEEVFNKLVGDEVYRWCPDCGFGIQQ